MILVVGCTHYEVLRLIIVVVVRFRTWASFCMCWSSFLLLNRFWGVIPPFVVELSTGYLYCMSSES